jgi:hypothetical protein
MCKYKSCCMSRTTSPYVRYTAVWGLSKGSKYFGPFIRDFVDYISNRIFSPATSTCHESRWLIPTLPPLLDVYLPTPPSETNSLFPGMFLSQHSRRDIFDWQDAQQLWYPFVVLRSSWDKSVNLSGMFILLYLGGGWCPCYGIETYRNAVLQPPTDIIPSSLSVSTPPSYYISKYIPTKMGPNSKFCQQFQGATS